LTTPIDAALLAEVAAQLHDQPDEERTAEAILGKVSEIVPDAQHASLTVRRHRKFVTLASSSEIAERADQLQYELDEGPCLDTAVEGDWTRSGDLGSERRWPTWSGAAVKVGVRSLLSVRLMAKEERIGALNLYATSPGRFADRDDVDLAIILAIHVSYALHAAQTVEGLQAAMASRHTIGVAQGILMERYDLDAARSFEFLRRLSNGQNRKLRDVAADIVELRNLHGPDLAGQMPSAPRGEEGGRRGQAR
jgi:GAF domain-containing protein